MMFQFKNQIPRKMPKQPHNQPIKPGVADMYRRLNNFNEDTVRLAVSSFLNVLGDVPEMKDHFEGMCQAIADSGESERKKIIKQIQEDAD